MRESEIKVDWIIKNHKTSNGDIANWENPRTGKDTGREWNLTSNLEK